MINDSTRSIIIGLVIGVFATWINHFATRCLRLLWFKTVWLWKRVFPLHIQINVSFGQPLQQNESLAVGGR